MRSATLERNTFETKIKGTLNLDGSGQGEVNTGVGFFDHMLALFKKHAQFDLDLTCEGDLAVDAHHTVEDCAGHKRSAGRQRKHPPVRHAVCAYG